MLRTRPCLYLIAIPLGLASFTAVTNAPWFQLPSIASYGWFEWPNTAGLVTVIVYHLVAAIYTMSITLALCKMLGVESTERRVRGAVAADGIGSATCSRCGPKGPLPKILGVSRQRDAPGYVRRAR